MEKVHLFSSELQWPLCPTSSVGLFLDSPSCSACLVFSHDHTALVTKAFYWETDSQTDKMPRLYRKTELGPEPDLSLCCSWPRMLRTWSMSANFLDFFPLFPAQNQPEKVRYTPKAITWKVALLCSLSPFLHTRSGLFPWLTVKPSHFSACL